MKPVFHGNLGPREAGGAREEELVGRWIYRRRLQRSHEAAATVAPPARMARLAEEDEGMAATSGPDDHVRPVLSTSLFLRRVRYPTPCPCFKFTGKG